MHQVSVNINKPWLAAWHLSTVRSSFLRRDHVAFLYAGTMVDLPCSNCRVICGWRKTLVSAMMVCTLLFALYYLKVHYQMFLGNEDKPYILDKAEGNAVQIAGHPAWASVW